jgi:hypothetical protein
MFINLNIEGGIRGLGSLSLIEKQGHCHVNMRSKELEIHHCYHEVFYKELRASSSCISSSRFWFIGFFAILMFLIILLSIFFMFFAIWLQDFFTPLLCCKFHFIMTLLQFAFCVWFVSPNKRYVILPLRMLFCSIAPQINFLTFHNLPLIYMFFGYNFT